MADISITHGCDSLAGPPYDYFSPREYDPIASACHQAAASGRNHQYSPIYATAQTWTTNIPPTAPAQHASVEPQTYGSGSWSTSSLIGQMLDGTPDPHYAAAPPYPIHDGVSNSIGEYFIQNPSSVGPLHCANERHCPSQTNFNDLVRLTVTVSSSGHSKRNQTPDTLQFSRESLCYDDVPQGITPSPSRSTWNNTSAPILGQRLSSDPVQLTTRTEHNTSTTQDNEPIVYRDMLPIVQSFRAIETAIATNNKRALKEAVSQFAAVMVKKETGIETSEPLSTGSDIGVGWQDHQRLCQAPGAVQDSNLTRLLALLQQCSSDNSSPLNDARDSHTEASRTRSHLSKDPTFGEDLASLILHVNQRHQTFPSSRDAIPSIDASGVETSGLSSRTEAGGEKPGLDPTLEMKLRRSEDEGNMLLKTQSDEDNDLTPLDLCKGNVLALSLKDQSTCRSLQKHVREASPKVRAAILQEALPHFVRLMTDPIGNYFCQTVLQVCSQEDLKRILDRVWKQLPAMSKSLYGTRAVQKLIERCCPSESRKLLKAFAGHFHDLAVDACGSHVIRQILESIPPEYSDPVHAEIRGNVLEIAMTKRGCCAVQKSLDYSTEQQKMLLVEKIMEYIPQLIQDPFGNYVIQHVLNMENASINSRILEYVLIDLWYLSKHKFASNVVERCVRLSNPYQLGSIMGSLVSLGVRKVRELLEDSFGNYVIQSVLETVPHETYGPLDRVVAFCLPDLNQTAHGRRIAQILLAKFPFLADTPKLYRDGKSRLNSDYPTDSSNVPTSDNSVEPRSSTENSRERSSSSSCSKAHKEKASARTSSGGDTSTKKPRSDDQLHGSQTDNSAMPSLTDDSKLDLRSGGTLMSTEISDAGRQTGVVRLQRPTPHNLSVAINRFRNSRRHQPDTAPKSTSSELGQTGGSAMASTNCDIWLTGQASIPRSRAYETSRCKPPSHLGNSPTKASFDERSSPRVETSGCIQTRED